MAGSRKCHARGPHLKAGVAHTAILRGKYHNHAWPTQKMPRVCEVISGLYCTFNILVAVQIFYRMSERMGSHLVIRHLTTPIKALQTLSVPNVILKGEAFHVRQLK